MATQAEELPPAPWADSYKTLGEERAYLQMCVRIYLSTGLAADEGRMRDQLARCDAAEAAWWAAMKADCRRLRGEG